MLRHRRKHRRLFGLPALATGIGVVGMTALMAVPAQAASASTSTSRSQPGTTVATTAQRQALTRDGTVNLTNLAQQASNQPNAEGPHRTHEVPLGPSPYARRNPHATANEPRATAQQASAATALSGNVAGEHGFTGLTAPDNAAVNGGLDVTPPDQGLAVGPSPAGTAVAEILNDVLAVYSPSGKALLGAVPAYSLFNLPSSAFLSDPRAYYDAPTHRWFFTMFTVGTVSPSGTVTSPSTQYIAVSQTSDVFGSYAVFSFDTTDQGQAGCPCFGDFDMIGADSNGFYITTNEFSISGTAYNGAHIYAVSK
ncbi:MAG: hypothetical protein ACRDZQ_12160, partial [Acidimicrobiales bacterium]